jgi:phosphoserine aminotransferase
MMISFYPGPSRVHDAVPKYVGDAFKKGVLSMNHRSQEFMAISEKVITLLKQKLNIPKDYTIFYTSSATECWEIITQSIVKEKSTHFYSGSFGEKWFDYTKRLKPAAEGVRFDPETKLDANAIKLSSGDVICLTHNETSNGTQVHHSIIKSIKKNNSGQIVAVDATSSMGGVAIDFTGADIWLASVQKCFGLPAGLGLLVCSPAAIQRSAALGEKNHYNSLTFMNTMMEKWQTPFTPNVLGIYLLMRVLEKMPAIEKTDAQLQKRYGDWVKYLSKRKSIEHLVKNAGVHSITVLPIKGTPESVINIKQQAKKRGILLGEGYGDLKASTFRIANFPAIRATEIATLKQFLSPF